MTNFHVPEEMINCNILLFSERFQWKGIKSPSEQIVWRKSEKNCLNILLVGETDGNMVV